MKNKKEILLKLLEKENIYNSIILDENANILFMNEKYKQLLLDLPQFEENNIEKTLGIDLQSIIESLKYKDPYLQHVQNLNIELSFSKTIVEDQNIIIAEILNDKNNGKIDKKQLYQIMANFSNDFEYYRNNNGEYLYISPSCENITGYKKEFFKSKHDKFRDIIHDEDKYIWDRHLSHERSSFSDVSIMFRIIRKDGEIRWIEHNCHQVYDKNNIEIGHRASNRDITEKIISQEKIIELNKKLEEEVNEKTFELKNALQKLEIIHRKEKEISDMKSNFIDLISHEYRTPLTIIMSSNELLKKNIKRDNPQRALIHSEKIEKSSQVLMDLINNIFTFSSIQSEDTKINNQHFDLRELIKDVTDEVLLKDDFNHQIVTEFNLLENKIFSDRNLIRIALFQLVQNAAKFSENDSRIKIIVNESVPFYIISVVDNGIGISAEDKINLFNPFFKNEENIGIKSGFGIGLSLLKLILKKLKANIEVKSELGQGSTFTFYLPKVIPTKE